MAEINYKDLDKHLNALDKGRFSPVYLIYGEAFLYKKALEKLLNEMVPDSKRSLNCEPIDGADGNVYDLIERLNTFSLLSGAKVVAFCDSKIFYSKQDEEKILEEAKNFYDKNDIKKAASYLIKLLGLLKLSFDDIDKEKRNKTLKLNEEKFGDDRWLDELINYCGDHNLTIPVAQNSIEALQKAIEKGFPSQNHLIITTDMVDKRRGLFKAIKKKGIIIDCSVSKGERKADRDAQRTLLYETMNMILEQSGKQMDKSVYEAMYEMTGFDLNTFSSNLEKLVSFVGDRKKITLDDVQSVLKRTKQDPIYELTGAIADKNTENALFYLDSLFSSNIFPLQILAAMTNQVRRLLVAKDFTRSPHGKSWYAGIQFYQFKTSVLPEVLAYDSELLNKLNEWVAIIAGQKPEQGAVNKKRKTASDLFIVKNPNNPYPVYQTLLKSENFTMDELLDAFDVLSQADLSLKTTGQGPKQILENVIFSICRRKRINRESGNSRCHQ